MEHPANGSPVYPVSQVHCGLWLRVTQVACTPQEPGQGSLQRSFKQARFPGHSAFIEHSGRQFGGLPI